MVELQRLNNDLRDQVIAPPVYSLFWLKTLFFVLTKAFLFVPLEPVLEQTILYMKRSISEART